MAGRVGTEMCERGGSGCVRERGSGQISRLCVLETRRNSGIGRALLVAAEEAARAAGMRIGLYLDLAGGI